MMSETMHARAPDSEVVYRAPDDDGTDPSGEFTGVTRYVEVSKLKVDFTYQREADPSHIAKIVREWHTQACSAIYVSDRGDGFLWIVDGYARKEAARKKSLRYLPAVVAHFPSVAAEAEAFIKINKHRRQMSSVSMHKPQLALNDPMAIEVDRLVASIGRRIDPSRAFRDHKTNFRCVAQLRSWLGRHPNEVRRVWPIIGEVCRDRPMTRIMVEGLIWLETKMIQGVSLTDRRWAKRVVDEIGYDLLTKSAQGRALAEDRAGARVWGEGMLMTINRNLRTYLRLDPSKLLTDEERENRRRR